MWIVASSGVRDGCTMLSMTKVHLVKSSIASAITRLTQGNYSGTIAGDSFPWPVHPSVFKTLYDSSEVHARCCHIKADNACGHGLAGDHADKIEPLCQGGSADLFSRVSLDLEVFANAFVELVRDKSKARKLLKLRYLPAATMSKISKGYKQQVHLKGIEKVITFLDDEILHIKGLCPSAGHYAVPDWMAAAETIRLIKSATDFNTSYFDNGAMPEYAVVFSGGQVDDKTISSIQKFFGAEFRGTNNAHRTLVLNAPDGGSVKIEKLTEARDGEFIKLIESSTNRIITAHGVPPRMVGVMSAGQLGGGGEVAQQLHLYNALVLEPRRRRMTNALQPLFKELSIKPGEVVFLEPDLTPPETDQQDRQLIAGWVSSGILTQQEAAAMLDLQKSNGQAGTNIASEPVHWRTQDALTKTNEPDSTDMLIAALARL